MTDYTKKMLLENLRKSFRHELVDMNLTRDRHNLPPLYDVKGAYVNEIESFFQSFLITKIQEAEQEMIKRVVGEMREYPKMIFELNNGKIPWVIWQGKADEGEKFALYKLGFDDACKILSALQITNLDKK